MKESKVFAFLLGFWECLRWGAGCGRTHPINQGWNDAYDRGMTAAERLVDVFANSHGDGIR